MDSPRVPRASNALPEKLKVVKRGMLGFRGIVNQSSSHATGAPPL